MSAEMQEKTPGVYVRANEHELPHELDMLWSNSRGYHREERSPLLPFLIGMLVGVLLSVGVFAFLIMQPNIIQWSEKALMQPKTEETAPNTAPTANGEGETTGATAGKRGGMTGVTAGSTSYTVVTGDTLGRISEKVYGSSSPEYVDKIQRANNMSSPDKLQIDQTLIIPPKDY